MLFKSTSLILEIQLTPSASKKSLGNDIRKTPPTIKANNVLKNKNTKNLHTNLVIVRD